MESGDGKLKTQRWQIGILVIPYVFMLCFGMYPVATIVFRLIDASASAPIMINGGDVAQLAVRAGAQALLSLLLAWVGGLPLAYALARCEFRGRRALAVLVVIPFVLPTVVTGLALRGLLGDHIAQGLGLVVLGHAFVNIAVIVRFVGSALEALDERFIVQAQSLGASRARAWWTVGWRLVMPSVVRASSIVFVYCFTSLGLVLVLGDRSIQTFESQVLRQVSLLLDFRGAALNTVVQFVLVAVVLWLGGRTQLNPLGFVSNSGGSRQPLSAGWRAFVLLAGLVYLAPFMWLVQQALVVNGQVTLAYWTLVSADGGFVAIVVKSVVLALGVGVLSSLVAGAAAVAATQTSLRRWSRIVLMPMMFTSATVGLGMLLSFSRAPFEWSRAGLPLLLAQTMLVLPVAYVSVLNRLDEVDPQMQLVAQSLGASRVRAYFSAYGSRLSSGMLAAAGLAAAIACGEYGAASFLSDFQSPTLTVQLMRQLGRPGESSLALASILAITLALVALAFLGGFETTSRAASKVRR